MKSIRTTIARLWRRVFSLPFNNPARYYNIGGGWGTAIWFDKDKAPDGMSDPKRKVIGFQPIRPSVGDALFADMKSGRVGVYIFTEVKLVNDPRDMFFASVEWRGYKDSLFLPNEKTNGSFFI